jgi:hypothetical protein
MVKKRMTDWYISPADRFSYETSFSKYSQNEQSVTLQQLDPLFHISRLETTEFFVDFTLTIANMAASRHQIRTSY